MILEYFKPANNWRQLLTREREYCLRFKDCVLATTLERASGSVLSSGLVGPGMQRRTNANPEDSFQFNSLYSICGCQVVSIHVVVFI